MVFSKAIDFHLVQFPIAFPAIYITLISAFPEYDMVVAFFTLLLLAEPHFGATWTLFLDRSMVNLATERKLVFIWFSAAIACLAAAIFFVFPSLFFVIFFLFNIYHVTRQSVGVCKLFNTNRQEISYQSHSIYLTNALIFCGVCAYHLFGLISAELALGFGVTFGLLSLTASLYQYVIYRHLVNSLTTLTGMLIFLPAFFVTEPIHAILAGVTMHYSQYLVMTFKIAWGKDKERNTSFVFGRTVSGLRLYVPLVLAYGMIASVLSTLSGNPNELLKMLIVFPLVGQILHFYIDGLIWKFSDPQVRDVSLKYLLSRSE